ncbi:MAG: hypothetical protein AB1758_02605 [Candidatus Eremiobacterota bacterium]
MNPEIRFRVPASVYERAEEVSDRLGLTGGRGRSHGVSELARDALYGVLGLPVGDQVRQLQSARAEGGGVGRDEGAARILLRVSHQVDPEVRRQAVLHRGEAVPAVQVSELSFTPGAVPESLEEFFELDARGLPHAHLDLSGGPSSPGCLVSAQPGASLEEVLQALEPLTRARARERERLQQRRCQAEAGRELLSQWLEQHGSAHLKALRSEDFDWQEVAELEFVLDQLARIGLGGSQPVDMGQSLAAGPLPRPRMHPLPRPSLRAIETLRVVRGKLSSLPGSEADLVEAQGEEAVLVSVTAPTGNRLDVLVRGQASPEGTSPSQRRKDRSGRPAASVGIDLVGEAAAEPGERPARHAR